jgi:indolepyruvate decarboxylase
MLGVEVRRFGLERTITAWAQRFGLPVVTSFMARGVAALQSPPVECAYHGGVGDGEISELVEQSDLIVALGVIACDTNFGASERQLELSVHALDSEVRIKGQLISEVHLRDFVAALAGRSSGWSTRAIAKRPMNDALSKGTGPRAGIVGAVGAAIRRAAEKQHLPLICDVGDALFATGHTIRTDLLAPAYYASMGFAVPAALGVQAVSGARPIVLVGDGAFQMTGWELGHCARYGWDPIVVVLNNRGWGMLRAFAPNAKFTELGEWSFARLADALGGIGTRIESSLDFAPALERAVSRRGQFHLIEVMLSPNEHSPSLESFVNAVAR